MKKLLLSKGHFALVDDFDYQTLQAYSWNQDPDGYVRAYIKGKRRSLHRWIMSPPRDKQVDHINGDVLDNRRSNLRICTHAENLRNSRLSKNNKTGYKGVSKTKQGKYYAKITVDKRAKYLGEYESPIEAARAYDEAAKTYFGEFANTNF